MSLVPYSSRDSRDIVFRHEDAIVVRDPKSKQLVLRGSPTPAKLTECPYCHRPLPSSSSSEHEPRSARRQDSFVSPEYFRMLHLATDGSNEDQVPPSSPIRRLVQPNFPNSTFPSGQHVTGAEFAAPITTEPESLDGQGIKREAFSPNYFKKFFVEEKELGRGGKGVVILVKHQLDGVSLGHFACKRVPVGDDHAWLEKVLIEVQLLQGLSHPNLVSYRHVWLEDVQLNRFGPSVPCAFILQQYCNAGDLLHYVIGPASSANTTNEHLKEQRRRRSKGQLDLPQELKSSQRKLAFDEIYSFFKDITSGLAHLHASNYIHRDLKPSNCLLHKTNNDFRCLISDFGEVQAENIVRKSTGATGTISYCAPEVLRKDATGRFGNFTTKSDIFSLGMILYFMCFGRLPYSSAENIQEEFEDLDQLRAEISTWSGFKDERQERPDLPNQLYEFLKRLLSIDPAGRPSAGEILLALSTESGLSNPTLVSRVNSTASHLDIGKRIQPIDSPIPGTPVNSQRNRSLGVHQDTTDDSFPPSPAEPLSIITPDKNSTEVLIQRDRSQSPQTPLLMPPPSTRLSDLKTRFTVFSRQAQSWSLQNEQLVVFTAKFAIFILKLYSVTKPCLPLATNPLLAYPLLLLAALDLGLGTRLQPWRTASLIVLHLTVTFIAFQQSSLCAENRQHWEWNVD